MVPAVSSIHIECVNQNDEDESEDTSLLGKPESQRVAGTKKRIPIEAVGEQDAAPETQEDPDQEQYCHDHDIRAPVALLNLTLPANLDFRILNFRHNGERLLLLQAICQG